jgi:hypothetical protein
MALDLGIGCLKISAEKKDSELLKAHTLLPVQDAIDAKLPA